MHNKFLGAFAKLRKATVSFVMSVRLSAWNNSVPIGRIFMKFVIGVFLEKLSRKFKFNPLNAELNPICHLLALLGGATIVVVSRLRVNQNLTRITGTLHEHHYTFFYHISLSSS